MILNRSAWRPPNTVNTPAVLKGPQHDENEDASGRPCLRDDGHLGAGGGGQKKSGPDPSSGCYAAPQPHVEWERCNKTGANLKGADLRGANLHGTRLTGANLIGANLSGANLKGANFSGANLSGADLTAVSVSPQSVWRSGKNCTGYTVATCPK